MNLADNTAQPDAWGWLYAVQIDIPKTMQKSRASIASQKEISSYNSVYKQVKDVSHLPESGVSNILLL